MPLNSSFADKLTYNQTVVQRILEGICWHDSVSHLRPFARVHTHFIQMVMRKQRPFQDLATTQRYLKPSGPLLSQNNIPAIQCVHFSMIRQGDLENQTSDTLACTSKQTSMLLFEQLGKEWSRYEGKFYTTIRPYRGLRGVCRCLYHIVNSKKL